MQSEWQLKRTLIARPEGQRRWDCAYQLLVRWAMEQSTNSQIISSSTQEDNHDGNCPICTSFDQPATTEPNH
jgi:hypothetical protein